MWVGGSCGQRVWRVSTFNFVIMYNEFIPLYQDYNCAIHSATEIMVNRKTEYFDLTNNFCSNSGRES